MKNIEGCILRYFGPQQGPAAKLGRGGIPVPANLLIDQDNPCACVGSICHQDLGALGGRDLSPVVNVAPHQVGAGWAE